MEVEVHSQPPERRILLIDDEASSHKLLRVVMDNHPPIRNLVLLEAYTFNAGMEIVRTQKLDCCLLDLHFGGSEKERPMRAEDTINAMRETGLVDMVPTIIITGQIEPGEDWGYGKVWKEARFNGACGFLRKDRYLDKANREFLLHEISDAMLEFQSRLDKGIKYGPPART